jgi:hypothetical protein
MDPADLAILKKILKDIFSHEKERLGSETNEPDPLTLNRQDPKPVFRIRIHRIHMFLGLPDPDPLVRGMNPDTDPALDPDPSIIMQK